MTLPIITRRTYALTFGALLVLTALTTGVAFIDLGVFNTIAAVAIAGVKAVLIAFFFMHLIHSVRLVRVIAIGALVWLSIMLSLTLGDFITRGWVPVPGK